MGTKMQVIGVQGKGEVIKKLWTLIEQISKESIEKNNVFHIGLSGGSLISYLSEGAESANVDWAKWQLYFCDERYVHENDKESTFGQYKTDFLPHTKLNLSQFLTIDMNLSLENCANEYEKKMLEKFDIKMSDEIPKFDLLLLGMGPDGHTCSLFPNHKLLQNNTDLISYIDDSPKPPPKRITMTYKLINNAKNCMFALSGYEKASMVKRIMMGNESLPASLVKPKNGNLIWILDEGAGSEISY